MKSKLLRVLFLLVIFAALGYAVFDFMNHLSAVDGPLALNNNQHSVAEIASSYYGNLSRPLLPETSLGIPLLAQCLVSILLMVGIVLISRIFPKARRLVMLIIIFTILRQLVWRVYDQTIDLSSPATAAIGITIYGAEILAFFAMILGYFQLYGQSEHKSVSLARFTPEQLPSVDVFVCTYNEPISVVYRTLVGCQSMDYARKNVYLFDDGNRGEMVELAQKLGVHYISRENNTHAKAGNLNNALGQTQGDLVLVFDADHVPCKVFLQEVVGFFMDDKLAFVQTPQHFFTPDPFQRNLVTEELMNNEQDLFFHVIQPGNDYWGSAFFAGSGAVFRRFALEQIGGFAVETITEDTHTGLRLHAKKWKSIYYNKDLAAGLAQDSFSDFVKQRLRWARGMTQILCYDNPLFMWGLTLPQRICYLSGIWYFFLGLPRLVFLIAPLFFLLFGYKTVNAGFIEVLMYYLPGFMCLTVGYSVITRGIRHSFWSEVYETALCVYLLITTLATFISFRRAKFRVTPKGSLSERVSFNWRIVFPQVMVAILMVIGIWMAIVRFIYTPEYVGGIYTNLFWATYNLALLIGAIYVAQERPQFRLAPRIFRRIRCELRLLDGTIAVGYTTNISESGIALVFQEPIPVSGTMTLKVMDWDINESTVLNVQAIRSSVDEKNSHYIGFRIVNRTELQHQKLVRHMFGTPDTWNQEHSYVGPTESFLTLLLTPFRLSSRIEKSFKRRTPRFHYTLSCMLEVDDQHLMGFSNEISETGLSLFLKDAKGLEIGQNVGLQIQWSSGHISHLNAQIIRIEDAGDGQYKLGLNFANLSREQRLDIIQQVYRPREGLIRVAPSVNKTLSCDIQLASGQVIQGTTQEISEMGLIIGLQGSTFPKPEERVTMNIHWDEQMVVSYPGIVMDVQDSGQGYLPLALIYFHHLDLQTLETLSQKLHEPMESKAFNTLNAI